VVVCIGKRAVGKQQWWRGTFGSATVEAGALIPGWVAGARGILLIE